MIGWPGGVISKPVTPTVQPKVTDESCWRCGAKAFAYPSGAVLCRLCHFAILQGDITGIHSQDYYQTHCWRCETAEVPEQDELGLCSGCKEILR